MYLCTGQNRLRGLPESFCNLVSLEELELSKNHIERLPAHFGHLKNLRDLRLDNNQVSLILWSGIRCELIQQ